LFIGGCWNEAVHNSNCGRFAVQLDSDDIYKDENTLQKIVDKSFDELPVEIRNVPPSKELILFPGKISVVLKGGISKLGRLTNDSVKAFVDFWEIQRHEEEQIEPIIEIPPFTTLVDIKPKKLEYIIKQY